MLGGFTKVTQIAGLAQRQPYKLAVHSCRGCEAMPLQVLTIGNAHEKAEAKAPKAVAEAVIVEVG